MAAIQINAECTQGPQEISPQCALSWGVTKNSLGPIFTGPCSVVAQSLPFLPPPKVLAAELPLLPGEKAVAVLAAPRRCSPGLQALLGGTQVCTRGGRTGLSLPTIGENLTADAPPCCARAMFSRKHQEIPMSPEQPPLSWKDRAWPAENRIKETAHCPQLGLDHNEKGASL